MSQDVVICHGGLFDGRRIATAPGQDPRERIELLVPARPQPVTDASALPPRAAVFYVRCVYVLARTCGGRERLVYVPEDFYAVREGE
jgi:hypothetical protein